MTLVIYTAMTLGEKGLYVLFSGFFLKFLLKVTESFLQTKPFIDSWHIEQMKAQGQDALGERSRMMMTILVSLAHSTLT